MLLIIEGAYLSLITNKTLNLNLYEIKSSLKGIEIGINDENTFKKVFHVKCL